MDKLAKIWCWLVGHDWVMDHDAAFEVSHEVCVRCGRRVQVSGIF